MFVVTRAINQYDQDGDYLETVFTGKPSMAEIKSFFQCDDEFAEHILNGGGRRGTENTWYYLTEIQNGETYITKTP